ncbi:MAG: AMP-binding protein [Actinobacteria bacterium]|nr:AMP-binding protein [Actinomycetota bacterium]
MIYASDRPAPKIPEIALHEHVLGGARGREGAPAITDDERTVTFEELLEGVRAVAAGLAAVGIGAGDVVALFCPNCATYPIAVHGIIASGATPTPINSMAGAAEAAKQLRDAPARAVLSHPDLLSTATEAATAAGIETIFSLGAGRGAARSFEELIGSGGEPPTIPVDPATDLALLPYSSGTTGTAKGVMLSHRNLVADIEQVAAVHAVGADDVVLAVLPFFHIYGLTMMLNLPLSRGAHVVTMPRFDLHRMLAAMEGHRVTRAYFAPPILLAIANDPDARRYDLGSLRTVICGAAPLDEGLALRSEEVLGCPVRQGYGMTEASPTTILTYDDEARETPPGSVGKPLPGLDCRLVDPISGEDVGTGAQGELWMRGPQVMQGYLGRPEATAETLTKDGWLRTGDVAVADEEARIWVVDRIKELIKYKGYQVPPAELEAVLLQHPLVKDAAVVPKLRDDGEEVPKALVALDAGAELDGGELIDWFGERVAPYKRIREVEFVAEIPKSPSGKILRRLLRD